MKKALLLPLLACLFACNNGPDKPGPGDLKTPDGPKQISYSIINTFPHDTSYYTQGLTFYNGVMYEGTGLPGKSKLMKMDVKTGKPLQQIDLDPKLFGEGVVILRDTVYQLTWQDKLVLVYTLKDLKKVKEFKNEYEGWGLTTDGKELIATDGTSNLYFYNPTDFRLLRKQSVTEAGTLSYNLNELEYIDGYVYANQYEAPYIFKIDPASGFIVAKADLTEMWNRIKAIDPAANVPNGIAYDSTTKKIYVTGKLWPELYEIQFSN